MLLKVLKYRPFLIKPNNHELGQMFGLELETEEEIILHARKLKAVSYTHLDVYKRQQKSGSMERIMEK